VNVQRIPHTLGAATGKAREQNTVVSSVFPSVLCLVVYLLFSVLLLITMDHVV